MNYKITLGTNIGKSHRYYTCKRRLKKQLESLGYNYSLEQIEGTYTDSKGRYIKEKSMVITLFEITYDNAISIAKWYKSACNQESVIIEKLESKVEFI